MTGSSYEFVHRTIVDLQLANQGKELAATLAHEILKDKLPALRECGAITLAKLKLALEQIVPHELKISEVVSLSKILTNLDHVTNLAEGKPTERVETAITREKVIEVYESMHSDPVTNPLALTEEGVGTIADESDDDF